MSIIKKLLATLCLIGWASTSTLAYNTSASSSYIDNFAVTLSAPGATDAFTVKDYNLITAQYTVASIDTSLVVRLEGSLDGANWFNLSSDNGDTTITQNGTYAMSFSSPIKLDHIRFRFVTETGGTSATIAVILRGGR